MSSLHLSRRCKSRGRSTKLACGCTKCDSCPCVCDTCRTCSAGGRSRSRTRSRSRSRSKKLPCGCTKCRSSPCTCSSCKVCASYGGRPKSRSRSRSQSQSRSRSRSRSRSMSTRRRSRHVSRYFSRSRSRSRRVRRTHGGPEPVLVLPASINRRQFLQKTLSGDRVYKKVRARSVRPSAGAAYRSGVPLGTRTTYPGSNGYDKVMKLGLVGGIPKWLPA